MSVSEQLEYVVKYNENDDRPIDEDTIGSVVTPRIGDIEFTLYGSNMQPPFSVDTGARYKTKEPIGDPVIRQHLGVEPKEMTLIGECSPKTADRVDELRHNTSVELRHPRHSGDVQVDSTSTESMGKHYKGITVQKFTIEMTEVL